MTKILYFLLSLTLLTACLDEPDCIREASEIVKIAFKNKSTGGNLNIAIEKVEIEGIDSVFYSSQTRNAISIPLNLYSDDHSTKIIIASDKATDTLTFTYNSFTRLISPDCGAETFITDIDIPDHTVDSLKIVDRQILPGIPVNYEIYY